MLEKFVTGQETFRTRFAQALSDGDRDAALRIAHTLKGASGQIGATKVSQLAAQLESTIAQHEAGELPAALQQQADSVSEQLDALIAGIKG